MPQVLSKEELRKDASLSLVPLKGTRSAHQDMPVKLQESETQGQEASGTAGRAQLRLGLLAEMLALRLCTPPWAGLRASGGQATPVRVSIIVFPVGPDAQPLGWHPDSYRGNGYPAHSLSSMLLS